MSLVSKLVFAHLIVIAVGLIVLALSTAFIAPVDFSRHMSMMGARQGMMENSMQTLGAEIEANFRESLKNALLIAGASAMVVATILSAYVSQRIVRPIRALVGASQRIAAGHYTERLTEGQNDEIGDLTRSFNRMAETLAEAEKVRQQLIADVSHELKTPLASIKGYMEGLQDGVIAPTPETFELVHREADRLQRLVQDLQELSRAEASQLKLNIQPTSAIDIVKAAMDALYPQFEEENVKLRTALPADAPMVRADPDRVRQVLINLLGNALQYTPSSGEVTVRLAREGTWLRFSVEDTGIGLASQDLERVFQRFYRVDKSRARSSGGSGIGLTISRHIIEAHGGRIWAESAGLGRGSTFCFTLPLS